MNIILKVILFIVAAFFLFYIISSFHQGNKKQIKNELDLGLHFSGVIHSKDSLTQNVGVLEIHDCKYWAGNDEEFSFLRRQKNEIRIIMSGMDKFRLKDSIIVNSYSNSIQIYRGRSDTFELDLFDRMVYRVTPVYHQAKAKLNFD